MKNQYRARDAGFFVREHPEIPRDLALCIYTSRLLGDEPSLVLQGGGNTSVKVKGIDLVRLEVYFTVEKG